MKIQTICVLLRLLVFAVPRPISAQKIYRIGALISDDNLVAREAAKRFGFELWEINVADRKEIEQIVPQITHKVVDAVFFAPDRVTTKNLEIFAMQCLKERLL